MDDEQIVVTPAPEALLDGVEPAGWKHTLHMEHGQSYERLTLDDGTCEHEPSQTGFGRPGRDYSEEHSVTAEPLYTRAQAIAAVEADRAGRALTPAQAAGPVLLEALAKGGFMMTETHNVGEHRGRKLVIGFQNADDADQAMQAVAEALVAWRSQS